MSQLFNKAVNYLSGGEGDPFIGASVDIETHRLSVKSVLGDGGFGKVYRVTDMTNGQDFALKRLFVPESAIKQTQQEMSIHRKISGHPNICVFVSGAAHPIPERRGFAEFLMLLEFCPGSLASIIRAAGTKLFSSSEVLRLFHGVTKAVQHLHSYSPPIIHRDIKAENVILSSAGVVKLCDFGSATRRSVRPTEDWSHQQRAVLEDEVQCSTTPCYRAPEMIDYYSNNEIGTKSDIWALGCFLYFICYFDLPYDDNKLAIVNAKYKPPNEHLVMFTPFLPIIRSVFKTDPSQRPTASQILLLLKNIATDKDVDPTRPPFPDFIQRQTTITAPQIPPDPVNHAQNRSSWIGYLKGGAESILKEAKSASEKVVGAVVQASSMYSTDKLDEGQLIINQVTTRITAVSFPDPNTLETVEEMVRQRYGNGAYFINLTEHEYFKESFGGRILNAGWSAHHPPLLKSLAHIIGVMDRWLLVAPGNVLIVHCQTGTGNTAILLSSYFLSCGLYKSPSSALQHYSNCRALAAPTTGGVVTASQKRYVEYIERLLYNSGLQHSNTVILVDLVMAPVPLFSVNRSNCKPFLEVFENGKKILSTLREPDVMRTYSEEDGTVKLPINMGVCGDIRVAVYHARNFIGGKMSAIKMFQTCFNTSFLDPEASSMLLPKSRLDGMYKNESKFSSNFEVGISLSVQGTSMSRDPPYSLSTSSLGIKPPVCCQSNEEFNRIISKTPDKGFKKADPSRSNSISTQKAKDIIFEDEVQDSFLELDSPPNRPDKLINLMNSDKPTPMSDPMSRKSPHKQEVLLDFLAPATNITANMTTSSSAPNLVEFGGLPNKVQLPPSKQDDEFSNFFSSAPPSPPAPAGPADRGHKRNESINLMDIRPVEDDIIDSFDLIGKPKKTAQPAPTVTPNVLFDPFGSSVSTLSTPAQPAHQNNAPTFQNNAPTFQNNAPTFQQQQPYSDPFLTPVKQTPVNPNMASPLRPQRMGGPPSGSNSPITNRSRNVSPRASPMLNRKSNDPFSDFVLDTKTSQIHYEKPAAPQQSGQTSQQSGQTSQSRPRPPQATSFSTRPNYFASSAPQSSGSVFGNEQKPWQQHNSSATNDAFGDLLSGQKFSSNQAARTQSLDQQRRGELEKTTDPVALKIMDWTKGKEDNIRALLSSLGDVLWDGETRWPKPGMHLMIEPNQVKKMYRNASRVVHPDKQVGTSHEDLAKAIQTELNDAYTAFEDGEL